MLLKQLAILLFLATLLVGCSSADGVGNGTTIDVQLANAGGLSANLDRIVVGGEKEMLKRTDIGPDGSFAFEFADGLSSGLYQIRVGAQKATFAIDAGDKHIAIDGAVADFSNYQVSVSGSAAAAETADNMQKLQELSELAELRSLIEEVENPYTAAYIAFNSLLRAGEAGLPIHESVVERLPKDDPNYTNYNAYLEQLRQQIAFQNAAELIQPGQPAPDLSLPGPDGATVRLSDLKGQVVLLDFWAAWCGPCRRENPNVVKVYDRYKDKGFTIYSVSLDGVRPQQAARMTAEQLAEATENQREKWVAAIEQDGLSWPNHGSELKYWSGEASAKYGVRAIPATFLIDREGNIAEIGLRGAAAIEQALQRVL